MPRLLVLDDDRERAAGFAAVAPKLGKGWSVKTWADPAAMLDELDGALAGAGFIALEASIARPVVERLARRAPVCPVTLHWRNSTSDAAWSYLKPLFGAAWEAALIYRPGAGWDQWHEFAWLREAQDLLERRTDTAANRAHAANCDRIQRQFEGREAIYVEKFVRRVRVSHIRAHVDARRVEAYAHEILTPGLGVPARYGLPSRWRFGGGYPSRFSADTWSVSAQGVSWSLYFAPQLISEVVRLADTLPPEEVYESTRLHELIWELAKPSFYASKPVFPSPDGTLPKQ